MNDSVSSLLGKGALSEGRVAQKITAKKLRVGVIGLGQIGLMTATVVASRGFTTVGADVNRRIVSKVALAKTHIDEPGLDKLLKSNIRLRRLSTTTDVEQLTKESDLLIVCVQTPLSREGRPDLSFLEQACKLLGRNLSRGKLISVESSIPPGTTENFIAPTIEGESGLKCDSDLWLAHCPERLSPGRALEELRKGPRVVGGYNESSGNMISRFYREITEGELLVTDARTAEVVKLAENAARDVGIAFANELALLCERLGVDASSVINLANSHPRVRILQPGPGVGGPCLPKDPFLLTFFAEAMGFRPKLIRAAREVNDAMPEHAIELVQQGLAEARKHIKGSKVAVLGTAYKGNVRDTRESPARLVIRGLLGMGAKVTVFDPRADESFGAPRARTIQGAVVGADCIIILTEHDEFKGMKLRNLVKAMRVKPVLVDTRHLIDPTKATEAGFIFRGVGYGLIHRPQIPTQLFRPWT